MRREFRYAISALCGTTLIALAAVPESVWTATPAICLFRNMLGVECFGCGMTRALSAALHGQVEHAMALNAAVSLTLPALVAGAGQGLLVRR